MKRRVRDSVGGRGGYLDTDTNSIVISSKKTMYADKARDRAKSLRDSPFLEVPPPIINGNSDERGQMFQINEKTGSGGPLGHAMVVLRTGSHLLSQMKMHSPWCSSVICMLNRSVCSTSLSFQIGVEN